MPSRRTAVRRQQQAPPQTIDVLAELEPTEAAAWHDLEQSFLKDNLSAIWHAIAATKTADQFLNALGISEKSIQALTETEFQSRREQVTHDMVAAIMKAPNS